MDCAENAAKTEVMIYIRKKGGTRMEEIFYDAADVAKLLGISKSKAYTVIRALNNELAAKGFMVLAGRVSKKYFAEKFYGMKE